MTTIYNKTNINSLMKLKYYNNIINYKNIKLLLIFLTEGGQIYDREETGLTSKQQHLISKSIKQARDRGLIPNTFNIKIK